MKKAILIAILVIAAAQLPAYILNVKLGVFHPFQKSDLWEMNIENLIYRESDLTDFIGGVEFEVPVNRFVTLAFEISSYRQEILSEYRDYEYGDGSPIYQNFSLSIVPYELGVKIYPLSFSTRFTPFINVGAGLYQWRFHQWGEFIDFSDMSISDGDAISDKLSFGYFAKGGFLFRFQRSMGVSLEGKYQSVKGELSDYFQGFEKFDLGGWSVSFGLNLFF